RVGTVAAIENYGAGDLLEIEQPDGRKSLIPFKPGIADLEDGRILLDPLFLACSAGALAQAPETDAIVLFRRGQPVAIRAESHICDVVDGGEFGHQSAIRSAPDPHRSRFAPAAGQLVPEGPDCAA